MTLCTVHLLWKQIMRDTGNTYQKPGLGMPPETFIILVAGRHLKKKEWNTSTTPQSLGKQWTTGAGTWGLEKNGNFSELHYENLFQFQLKFHNRIFVLVLIQNRYSVYKVRVTLSEYRRTWYALNKQSYNTYCLKLQKRI